MHVKKNAKVSLVFSLKILVFQNFKWSKILSNHYAGPCKTTVWRQNSPQFPSADKSPNTLSKAISWWDFTLIFSFSGIPWIMYPSISLGMWATSCQSTNTGFIAWLEVDQSRLTLSPYGFEDTRTILVFTLWTIYHNSASYLEGHSSKLYLKIELEG